MLPIIYGQLLVIIGLFFIYSPSALADTGTLLFSSPKPPEKLFIVDTITTKIPKSTKARAKELVLEFGCEYKTSVKYKKSDTDNIVTLHCLANPDDSETQPYAYYTRTETSGTAKLKSALIQSFDIKCDSGKLRMNLSAFDIYSPSSFQMNSGCI